MAKLVGYTGASEGLTTDVHATARNKIGTRVKDSDGNEYIYLHGVASTVAGSVVTYDMSTGLTTLVVANGKGVVAVAMAVIDTTTKAGWYCIFGVCPVDTVANSAAGATVGRETTNGKVGDGRVAGDEIVGMIQLAATTAAAVVNHQLSYPFVNDFTGA